MKYKSLFLAFFSVSYGLLAQSLDFVPLGAKWYYTETQYAPPSIFPHIVAVESKEMYQGKLCSKLSAPGPGSLPEIPCYVYTQGDSVFFYSHFSNQFEMLYDFSAAVGDSWVIGGLAAVDPPISSDTIRVDSISTININGTNLKVWHISNSFLYDWGDQIIETIGNTGLFAPRYGFFDIAVWGLRCYESPNVDYHLVPYPCDTVIISTSTKNPTWENEINLLPTPFQDRLTIVTELSFALETFTIYDQTGALMLQKPIFSRATEINTANLAPGLYYYTLTVKDKGIKRGKLLKVIN